MVSLYTEFRDFCQNVDKLIDLQTHISPLEPKYSKMVAEIILIRLFDIITASFASTASKMVSGATYIDGTRPVILSPTRSQAAAFDSMRTRGRSKPKSMLNWVKVDDIKDNTKYVIDQSEHFIRILDNHSIFIDEMRVVRNRIAHNNKRTRTEFRNVVLKYFGAKLNFVSPGWLLLSSRHKPSIVEQYLHKSKALMKALVKA